MVEYYGDKVGLGGTGDTFPMGMGGPQGGRIFLQGGGSSYTTVWFGDVGTFGSNGEEVRIDSHRVPQTDHG